MPSLGENKRRWDGAYEWADAGEEWSRAWGGSEAQWYGTIFPRLHAFVPVGSLLEIGPGYGRWTRYLRDLSERLVLVDLSERCIEACRERFGEDDAIAYHVNDGLSLEMVSDSSIDMAFSFDTLVHVEADVIESYVSQLSRKLTPHGVAFFHHSNFAALNGEVENEHGRGESVSAEVVAEIAAAAGIAVVAQERVNWGSEALTDCISVLTPAGSEWERTPRVVDNPAFMSEALRIASWAPLYSTRT